MLFRDEMESRLISEMREYSVVPCWTNDNKSGQPSTAKSHFSCA